MLGIRGSFLLVVIWAYFQVCLLLVFANVIFEDKPVSESSQKILFSDIQGHPLRRRYD